MADRRRIFALGAAGVILALELMQPSALITGPLLLASLCLVAWAIVPGVVRRGAERTGPASRYLLIALNRLDALLAHVVDDSGQSKKSLDRIADMISEGSDLLNRPVRSHKERDAWMNDYRSWTDEVFSEIQDNFGRAQAIAFRTIGVPDYGRIIPFFDDLHNSKKLRLKKRLDKLIQFVNANSNAKA